MKSIRVGREELLACCGSARWVDAMLAAQPFDNRDDVHATAESIWSMLSESDWLEAFSHHPKIGEKPRQRDLSSDWSRQEQAAAAGTGVTISSELERLNEEYENRFGFIFIICASGKSAPEMLAALQTRLINSRQQEIRNAAQEQAKIMHLRLDRLFETL